MFRRCITPVGEKLENKNWNGHDETVNNIIPWAAPLESFDSRWLRVTVLRLSSNYLRTLNLPCTELLQSFDIYAPNLEVLRLTSCENLQNIRSYQNNSAIDELTDNHLLPFLRVYTRMPTLDALARRAV